MFQKLYRHLEDIKNGLSSLQREDPSCDTAEIGERAIDQLELINMGLRSMERRSAKANMVGFMILVVVIIACTGIFVGGARLRGKVEPAVSVRLGNGPGFGDARSDASVPGGLVPDAEGYVGEGSQPKPGVSGEEQRQLTAHLGKLDSLIAEQAKTIKELKDLNATSVATFRRMRRHFAVTEGAPAKAKVEGDSAVAVQ